MLQRYNIFKYHVSGLVLGMGNACITQTADSGFAVFGSNYFKKFNQNGNLVFANNQALNPRFWQQTVDKGYILAKDNKLIKTDCEANFVFWDVLACPYSSSTTLTKNISEIENVKIFPNPSKGILNIDAVDFDLIEVFNFEGKLIQQKFCDNELKTIDLSSMPNGMYLIRIIVNGNVVMRKIVKE